MRIFTRLILIFSISFTSIVAAQNIGEEELEAFFGDEEFISIATGIAQPISKAPAVASVITAKDITQIGAVDIDEVLETVPGLHVSNNNGYTPVYVFRGIKTSANPQVLMLINGFPITNLYNGDRNLAWGGMPVEAISRIEIIRGPGSAIYGADAFAGVINIITKSPAEVEGIISGVRYGSFDTQDFWVQAGGNAGELKMMAIIEVHKTDGQHERINADAQSFLDLISGTSASLAPGNVNVEADSYDARIELNYNNFTFRSGAQVRKNLGLGAGIAQALDQNGRVASDRYNADLTYNNTNFSENFGIKASVSYLQTTQEVDDDLVLFPPESRGPFLNPLTGAPIFPPFPNGIIGNPEVYERHSRANLIGTYRGFSRHEVLVGTGYYHGEVYKTEEEKNFGLDPATGFPILPGSGLIDVSDTPLVFLPEGKRENSHVFLQDVWHFANDWELTAGLRYDHYSDFGDTTNPRLAVVWSASHNLTIKALYGEAFRAPSFAETKVQSNPAFRGNTELKPEELKSYELALNYRPTFDISLDLNLFHYKWKDIIQFVPDPNGSTRTAQNAGEQNGTGVEFEVNWDINDQLSILANYSWQDSEDESTDTDAAESPEQQFYIRAFAELPFNFDLSIQLNSVMDRSRAFGDMRGDVDDYTTVDFTLRKRFLTDKLQISLLTKNVFDEDVVEPSPNAVPVPFIPDDLPLAGRRILGEIRYKFN